MDEPIPEMGPPHIQRCAVCGERTPFGFGPPGGTAFEADAWYCGTHREEAERLWSAILAYRRLRRLAAFGVKL